tara:strand:+ start:2932 stop:3168 length:237 start_codon:yes stop_codon:yes gene_type:complete
MQLFRRTKAPKSLYTPQEEIEIKRLVDKPGIEAVHRIIELQQIQVNREVRIIEGKTTDEDAKLGFTRKEFPWLAKFNY